MMQDDDLMTLYILGLKRFQEVEQANPLSYFQIAGIHGRPYIPYDGAGKAGQRFGGYCTHSSILFPPWHRPYLALFEQALGKHVTDIANEYPSQDKARYVAAAKRFRIPYWDWAANADLPDFISLQETVTLNTPQGQKAMKNPLYSYTFNPVYSDFGDGLPNEKVWESWPATVRWPTTTDTRAKSNGVQLERNLSNNRLTIRDRTYNLLTQARDYAAFSNDGFEGNMATTAYDSLESVHGQIHGMTGRNGHMGVVDFAAFDPVFWLHHTNCDRVFALWQALNPSSYVVPRVNQAGTFATAPGTRETVDSPLAPFWKSEGTYWTSAGVRDTRTLNYTYPELAKWAALSPQEKSTRLRTDINLMYGKNAAFAALSQELFNHKPSVPTVGRTSDAVTNMKPLGINTGNIPTPVPVTSPGPTSPATAPVPAGGQAAAQQPVKAPAKAPLDAATIRKNMEAGMQAARDKAAASAAGASGAGSKVAAPVPASVSRPVAAAGGAVAGAAQAVAGGLAAAVPGKSSQPAAERQSFEITEDKTHPQDKKHYNEWLANISVEKYAAKTSFFVYIFLGDFTPDPKKWGEDPNLVGTHVVFANNMEFTGCENCRDAAEAHKLVTGTIPLTGALGDRLGKDKVGALEPSQIVPYLKKELHWRIQRHDETVIERAEMPSLKISVAHVSVALPDNIAEFPKWGDSTKEAGVTTGRAGGATEND